MNKAFTKGLFLLLLPLLVITAAASAQTITVGAIDPGPYGRGSSISVPFKVTGCITDPTNIYTLYLSDAAGNFGAATAIGTYTGFYATFINGIIPNAVSTSGNYKVRISSNKPVTTSAPSAVFTITAVTGLKAGMSSSQILSPDVFGQCAGADRTFNFTNTSDFNNPATATFFNELTQVNEGTIPLDGNFAATTANYTVTVKTTLAGIIGTKSYQLINNVSNNSFTITGNGSVCLGTGNTLDYNVDINGSNGIQKNYPGLLYNITWGDGRTSVYTFCEIVAANGKVSHAYTTSSCGNVANQRKNVFQIDIQPKSPYCTNITQPVTTYASVLALPQNSFISPVAACLNSPVTFTNTSAPGDDPNSTALDCRNIAATYTWLVDGVIKASGRTLSQPFVTTFTTNGIHKVTLRFENNNGLCDALDVTQDVCIQKSPQPDFVIPAIYCLADGPLTPVNTSVVDEVCNTNTTYKWVQVSGPAGGVNFNAALKTPIFTFNSIGVYQFRLDITTLSCGTVAGPVKQIVVNSTPTATLSPNTNECGKGVTLSFDPASTSTKTIFDGTAQALPTTYTWVVTSPDGGTSSFAPGSTTNSQYPRIIFNDYATYNISVTHTNNCGTVIKTQQLKFAVAPTVSAGPPQPNVCYNSPIVLNGSPGVGGLVTAVKWTSPTGGTFSDPNSPSATYTPTTADIANGQVLLTYTATTSLAAPCNQIPSTVLITIVKMATVASSNTAQVCSGSTFNYIITSANPATTFSWNASVISGSATGFTANGSGSTITDIITNNTNADAVVAYVITPMVNGCAGSAFGLRVTVHPLPVFTPPPVVPPICSGESANITLTSNINPTTYTWTSVAGAGITGNTNRSTAAIATSIQDMLVNTSGTQGTVTYTITPYNGTCPGASKPVTITVNPAPVKADAGPDQPVFICAATYPLQGNNPSPGTGAWSPVAGITFSDKNDPHAIASGLLPGQTYHFTWTITAAVPGCPPSSDIVTVTRSAAAVGGTTATTTPTVCSGTNVVVTLTGQVGTIVWQQSINGGANWVNIPNQTTPILTYPNILQTTQFRAVVTSGACAPDNSTVTTITVMPQPPTADAGTYPISCNAPSVILTANDPGTFTGKWKQVGGPTANIFIETPNNFITNVTGLTPGNTYQFQWTIFAKAPCTANNISVATIINGSVVTPDFIPSKTQVCGSGAVTFTNTSTPDLPGTVYEWDFGDSSPVSHEKNPSHPFQPNANGTDVKRTVSLTITSNCTPLPPKKVEITVSPETPDAHLRPPTDLRSCGDLNLTVENASTGTNDEYTFHLVDENGADIVPPVFKPRGDKSAAVFQTAHPIHTAIWHLYVEAKNNCDAKKSSDPINIPVSPSDFFSFMQIKDSPTYVCFGTPVFFRNLSTGGDTFKYTIYDGNDVFITAFPGGREDFRYIFPRAGKYKVSILASTAACNGSESVKYDIEVIPLPQPDFLPSVDIDNNATFVNITPGADSTPSESLIYEWNFGDGSPVDRTFTPARHSYSYENSPYTVTLTATIPGSGCSNIKVKTIEIKFTGELFLPNAFQPASSKAELRTFKAKGQKLKEWRMQVFNNWGQLVWQTTQLNSNGEPTEGWDGTFKGAPAQQGVYVWQITAKFLNGSDWKGMSYNGSLPKRSGTINLIR
jgi:PKD repeat protein